jgi:hypothetical protein
VCNEVAAAVQSDVFQEKTNYLRGGFDRMGHGAGAGRECQAEEADVGAYIDQGFPVAGEPQESVQIRTFDGIRKRVSLKKLSFFWVDPEDEIL